MASTVLAILVTTENSVKTVRTQREHLVFFVITPRLDFRRIFLHLRHSHYVFIISSLDPCDIWNRKNVTCKHDGNCIIKKTSNSANASCECAKGFHGEHCEIRNDKIESNLKANFI